MLEILYQDEYLIAINKPPGLLVHRSPIARDATEFAVQTLRNQVNKHVYPVHRLDRKTSGILLFALDEETNAASQRLFAEKTVSKHYIAIVRGYTADAGEIDYPLTREDGKKQDAITNYTTISRAELAVPFGKHETSRYSLVHIEPVTGRMHQIRKHFAHILHPIIGDRPHGCNKQNKLFLERWQMSQMLLHAVSLGFIHPVTRQELKLFAPPFTAFKRMMSLMDFSFSKELFDQQNT